MTYLDVLYPCGEDVVRLSVAVFGMLFCKSLPKGGGLAPALQTRAQQPREGRAAHVVGSGAGRGSGRAGGPPGAERRGGEYPGRLTMIHCGPL